MRQAQCDRQPRGVAPVIAVRSEAVDAARVDAGVPAGGEDGLQRELELRIRRLAVLVVRRLADADHGDLAAERAGVHATVVSMAAGTRSPNAPPRASSAMRGAS